MPKRRRVELERLQIDLIDLRHEADGHIKLICHIKDHFTKFSALLALPSKEAIEVANALSIHMIFESTSYSASRYWRGIQRRSSSTCEKP